MKYAVIDSGPLIKGVRLETIGAERYVTVPEVLLELRDRHVRERLASLPFELETREPSQEALDVIRKFAKLTGDLPALSAIDIRVLALAWLLEKETKNGVEHLRTTPLPPGAARSRRPPADEPSSSTAQGMEDEPAIADDGEDELDESEMNLKLLGADGMILRSVKQWVMRCSGCFTQQSSLESQFCSKCGNMSLVRLQAVVDDRGQQRLLPESKAPARVRSTNTRGTKFPLPMPVAGRHAHNLILAEDQLAEAVDKARRQGKAKMEDVFDPDYSLEDHFGRAGSKRPVRNPNAGSAMPKVGYGKRVNPNDVRARPKRT
eukprot:jgi/Chrpa1/12586/Chrysochromulina_OHIO_Genome00019680-RA